MMAGEATFARQLRAAAIPVMVIFEASRCDASRALLAGVARLAERHAEQVLVLRVDVDRSPMLAEQYGVVATPTVLVLQDGEELTRMIGFAPEPLVSLLFEHLLAGELIPGRLWSPIEQAFEDTVIIPLLDAWGWTYRRQAACPLRVDTSVARGRVDILVYADDATAPLTLFENKRQIATSADLQQAVAQARRYAEAFRMVSFVVAAPAGMWVYRLDGGRAGLIQAFSSLEIATRPEAVKHTLRWI
jgi:thioredoxin-like negative regulator of GroEL